MGTRKRLKLFIKLAIRDLTRPCHVIKSVSLTKSIKEQLTFCIYFRLSLRPFSITLRYPALYKFNFWYAYTTDPDTLSLGTLNGGPSHNSIRFLPLVYDLFVSGIDGKWGRGHKGEDQKVFLRMHFTSILMTLVFSESLKDLLF